MTVKTEYQAWEAITALFPDEYKKDEESSAKGAIPFIEALSTITIIFVCWVIGSK